MPDSPALDYAAKLEALTDSAMTLSDDARKRIVEQLKQAADQVRADLAKADPASLSAARLRSLKGEVDRVMAQFAGQASNEVNKAQRAAMIDAGKQVDAVVTVGIPMVAVQPVIDTKMLTIAQGYSADLITGLSRETSSRVNAALQRAALGGSTHAQLVEAIGSELEGGKFSGVFSEAGARAQTIAINEPLRMHAMASQARMGELASRHAGIQKEWLHLPIAFKPRPSHVLASGQVRPVNEPFTVGGEQLMYPRDPSGSAENTINCHCLNRPKLDPALLKPSDQERALLDRLGIKVTTTRH